MPGLLSLQGQPGMRSNKDIYASIFNHAIQAIILIDRHGIIRDANPASEEIFGYSPEQLLGIPVPEEM